VHVGAWRDRLVCKGARADFTRIKRAYAKYTHVQAHTQTHLMLTSACADLRRTNIAPTCRTPGKQLSPCRHALAGASPTGAPMSTRRRGGEGPGGGLRGIAAKNIASARKLAQGALAGEMDCKAGFGGPIEQGGARFGDGDGSELRSDCLVTVVASADDTAARLNASSGGGSEQDAWFGGWDVRPVTPNGVPDSKDEMSEASDLSASRGPAVSPVLWV